MPPVIDRQNQSDEVLAVPPEMMGANVYSPNIIKNNPLYNYSLNINLSSKSLVYELPDGFPGVSRRILFCRAASKMSAAMQQESLHGLGDSRALGDIHIHEYVYIYIYVCVCFFFPLSIAASRSLAKD